MPPCMLVCNTFHVWILYYATCIWRLLHEAISFFATFLCVTIPLFDVSKELLSGSFKIRGLYGDFEISYSNFQKKLIQYSSSKWQWKLALSADVRFVARLSTISRVSARKLLKTENEWRSVTWRDRKVVWENSETKLWAWKALWYFVALKECLLSYFWMVKKCFQRLQNAVAHKNPHATKHNKLEDSVRNLR